MRSHGSGLVRAAVLVLGSLSPAAALSQSTPEPPPAKPCTATMTAGCPDLAVEPKPSASLQESPRTSSAAEEDAKKPAATTLEIPAGIKVLLTIRSAINTKTASPGDGVYLQSSFPVVANGRAVIPAGVYVQGVVDSVERHIRIKGPAKLTMHFTSMIFPNGSVVEIPGQVNSLPGSDGPKVKGSEGTVEQHSSAGDVAKAAGQGRGSRCGRRRYRWRSQRTSL